MAIHYDEPGSWNAFDEGRNRLQSVFDQGTRARAGRAQAAGDYTAAANTLAGGGLTDEAQKTRTYGQGLADDAATREGLNGYVAGDYVNARGAFAKAGNLAGVQAADAGAKATREQSLQVALKIANAVEADVGQGHDPAESFDKAAPLFAKLFPDSAKDLPQYREAFIKDPAGTIAAIKAATAKELEAFTLSQGQSRYGPDGKLIASVEPEQKYEAVPAGGMLVPVPHGGGAPASVPGPPASGSAPGLGSGPRPFTAPTPEAAHTMIDQIVPGVKVTSGARTPEHNAAVGGVANSYHLQGRALDLVPPAGMSMPQLEQHLRSSGYHFKELLNEGDHVHVAWDDEAPQVRLASNAPPGAIMGPAKEQARPATAAEKAQYGIAADVPAQMKPDGTIDVISGTGAALKPVPAVIQTQRNDHLSTISQIDRAIHQLQYNPHAMGLANKLGDGIRQRLDPNGIPVRAAVANIGSQIIHDRSGAAVTVNEMPRLAPFIPAQTDTAAAAIAKLTALKDQLSSVVDQIDTAYGEDSGYRPIGGTQGGGTKAKTISYDATGKRLP